MMVAAIASWWCGPARRSTSAPPTAPRTGGFAGRRRAAPAASATGGLQRDVTFAEAAADARDGIDAANQAKYGQHGRAIVGTVTGPDA